MNQIKSDKGELTQQIKTPRILEEFFWTPEFQSLLALSEKKPFPRKGIHLMDLLMIYATKEDLEKHLNSPRIIAWKESSVSEFAHLKIVTSKLKGIQDLRELYNAGFLTVDVVRHLLAQLIIEGKAALKDIVTADSEMLGMDDLQIRLLQSGHPAFFTFSKELNEKLISILEIQEKL